jgi:hypothetical protein
MSRFLFCIRQSLAMMAGCLAVLAGNGIAQTPDKLPQTSDYLGEIRRGVDGKLMVLPEAELTTQRHPLAGLCQASKQIPAASAANS